MKIKGIKKVQEQLRKLSKDSERGDDVSVVVGYTAAYALYVHEAVEMKLRGLPRDSGFTYDKQGRVVTTNRNFKAHGFYWDPQGQAQAKFLEGPAREYAERIGKIVRNALKQGLSMADALIRGGQFLQGQSMRRVPVDTGNLKGSSFVELEQEGEA